ncbi:MAG TPA: nuclear transport factor 2 family protein [Terracidiphilus sp.]
MKRKLILLTMLICCGRLACTSPAWAQLGAPAAGGDEAAIRSIMTEQTAAWNRGDVDAFMKAYEDSPETTFIGTQVGKGYRPILERYKKAYSTPAQMGTLTFSDIDVRLLPAACGKEDVALVTGKFHLKRTEKGEATKDDGIFSLVWRKGPKGWKVVLDHTS